VTGDKKMNIKKFYQDKIDFEGLERTAYRMGMEDKNIQRILFYAGSKNVSCVLLFKFFKPSINGLFGKCTLGLNDNNGCCWTTGREIFSKTCHINYSGHKSFIDNWRIFVNIISTKEYILGELAWQNGKRKSPSENEDTFDNIFFESMGPIIEGQKIEDDIESALGDQDFVDDSWILNENGFNKFIMPVEPIVLYQRDSETVINTFKSADENHIKIDYSKKSKNDQKLLAKNWFQEGKTRKQIAILLFKEKYENNPECIKALIKRVDRLRGIAS
jgi:hypothetical protein